jgi:hypothetical protein
VQTSGRLSIHPRRSGSASSGVSACGCRHPTARFADLGSGYYDERISAERKIRSHVRQLEALGLTVTLTPAEDAA